MREWVPLTFREAGGSPEPGWEYGKFDFRPAMFGTLERESVQMTNCTPKPGPPQSWHKRVQKGSGWDCAAGRLGGRVISAVIPTLLCPSV